MLKMSRHGSKKSRTHMVCFTHINYSIFVTSNLCLTAILLISELMMKIINALREGQTIDSTSTLAAQTTLMVPTPLGIPMCLNLTYTHILRANGNIKLHGKPLEYIAGRSDLKLESTIRPRLVFALDLYQYFMITCIKYCFISKQCCH